MVLAQVATWRSGDTERRRWNVAGFYRLHVVRRTEYPRHRRGG